MIISKMVSRWKRLTLFLRMALISDGKKKAAYLKKIQYFGGGGAGRKCILAACKTSARTRID